MIESMLADVICGEFEKVVGKGQYETGKAMHIGFSLNCGDTQDQYRVVHMYIFAPANYVHVATQMESIDEAGERHIGKMVSLSYHDSCWRDAVQQFIFTHSGDLSVFKSFGKMFDWYTVLKLSKAEQDYLCRLNNFKTALKTAISHYKGEFPEPNPFDERGLWAEKRGGELWVEASA